MTLWHFVLGFFAMFMLFGSLHVIKGEAKFRALLIFGVVGAIAALFIWMMMYGTPIMEKSQ